MRETSVKTRGSRTRHGGLVQRAQKSIGRRSGRGLTARGSASTLFGPENPAPRNGTTNHLRPPESGHRECFMEEQSNSEAGGRRPASAAGTAGLGASGARGGLTCDPVKATPTPASPTRLTRSNSKVSSLNEVVPRASAMGTSPPALAAPAARRPRVTGVGTISTSPHFGIAPIAISSAPSPPPLYRLSLAETPPPSSPQRDRASPYARPTSAGGSHRDRQSASQSSATPTSSQTASPRRPVRTSSSSVQAQTMTRSLSFDWALQRQAPKVATTNVTAPLTASPSIATTRLPQVEFVDPWMSSTVDTSLSRSFEDQELDPSSSSNMASAPYADWLQLTHPDENEHSSFGLIDFGSAADQDLAAVKDEERLEWNRDGPPLSAEGSDTMDDVIARVLSGSGTLPTTAATTDLLNVKSEPSNPYSPMQVALDDFLVADDEPATNTTSTDLAPAIKLERSDDLSTLAGSSAAADGPSPALTCSTFTLEASPSISNEEYGSSKPDESDSDMERTRFSPPQQTLQAPPASRPLPQALFLAVVPAGSGTGPTQVQLSAHASLPTHHGVQILAPLPGQPGPHLILAPTSSSSDNGNGKGMPMPIPIQLPMGLPMPMPMPMAVPVPITLTPSRQVPGTPPSPPQTLAGVSPSVLGAPRTASPPSMEHQSLAAASPPSSSSPSPTNPTSPSRNTPPKLKQSRSLPNLANLPKPVTKYTFHASTPPPASPTTGKPHVTYTILPPVVPSSPPRAPRRHLPHSSLRVLERYFNKERNPGKEERERLAVKVGAEARQVSVWFQNRRAKERRERAREAAKNGLPLPPPEEELDLEDPELYLDGEGEDQFEFGEEDNEEEEVRKGTGRVKIKHEIVS